MQAVSKLAAALLMAGACAMPVSAASSASSASSEGISASIGSISDSIKKSSESSTGKDKVADGDYRVLEVAQAGQTGTARVRLQAAAEGGETFDLVLPEAALARAQLGVGDLVTARNQAYGIEFARTVTRQAFFLAVKDEWQRELASRPVVL